MKSLFILSIFICLISAQNYNSYKFAVELPGAVCRSQSCVSSYMGELGSYTLNLHGMWPNANSGPVENCLPNNYDESQFTSSIMNEMNSEWVGLYSSSATFRSHEWGKHGTCWAKQNENPSAISFLSYGGYS